MNRKFKGLGTFEVRRPTIEELTALFRARAEIDAQRKFIKAVLVEPTLAEIRKVYPGALVNLCDAVLEAYGAIGYTGEDLTEDELDDLGEDFLKAYVAQKTKSAELGKVDDLSVMRISFRNPSLSEPLLFITRKPRDLEVDEWQRDTMSFHLSEALFRKLCVHGPISTVAEKFPGLWRGMADRCVARAGVDQDIELDLA